MSKYLAKRLLQDKGDGGRCHLDGTVPSFCAVCGCQRIHVVVGFAKRGRCVLVELKCLHEYPVSEVVRSGC